VKHYLLSIYQPEAVASPEDLEPIMRELDILNQEMKAAGAFVFTNGLEAASTATVVREKDGDVLMTDGPFAEGKEHLGGLWIITAPDLDAALDWARKGARATTLPIEVRPFRGDAGD
jgi:hypothetical protein